MGWWKNILLNFNSIFITIINNIYKKNNKTMINQFLFLADFSFRDILSNPYYLYPLHYISILLVNIISYMYVITKFYKVMCYSKLTFEWLPMINPYVWPFSVFEALTGSYFRMWSRILPPIKFEKTSVEISAIIALEALNSVIYFCVRFSNILISILQETEKGINLS